MAKHIDLTQPQTVSMLFGEETIDVFELSYGEYQKVAKYIAKPDAEKSVDEEKQFVYTMLNRNKQNRKFSVEDIDHLPMSSIPRIFNSVAYMAQSVLNDPN